MTVENRSAATIEGEIVLPAAPWDQMPGESDSNFGHFQRYLYLGSARTVAKSAEAGGRSREYLHKLASQWQWVARAGAWDAEQFRLFAAKSADAHREMLDRHAKVGRTIMSIVETRLMSMPIDELSPADLVRLAGLAMKLERQSLADGIGLASVGAGLAAATDLTMLDEGARLTRLEALRGELDRRIRARQINDAGIRPSDDD